MRKFTLFNLYVFTVLISCQNGTTIENSSTISDSVSVMAQEKQFSIADSMAIGNIKMGCSKAEFEVAKKEFLEHNKRIGSLAIDWIEPIFVDGQLAEIKIVSERHTDMPARTEAMFPEHKSEYWEELYQKKYGTADESGEYSKGIMKIKVSNSDGGYHDMLQDIKNNVNKKRGGDKVRATIYIYDPRLIEIHKRKVQESRQTDEQKSLDII